MKGGSAAQQPVDAREHDSRTLTDAQEKHLVRIGKIAATGALIIGTLVAPLLGNLEQAFQYIQEYTGFISPGVVAVFILGMFWKRTSANAALIGVIVSFGLSLLFKFVTPDLPFLDRMGLVFVITAIVMAVISVIENKGPDKKGIPLEKGIFKTTMAFNLGALGVLAILAVIYAVFW
jgi:SSS family solute:Na+ symporter